MIAAWLVEWLVGRALADAPISTPFAGLLTDRRVRADALGGDVDQRYVRGLPAAYVLFFWLASFGASAFLFKLPPQRGHTRRTPREKPRPLSDEMIKAVKPYDADQN